MASTLDFTGMGERSAAILQALRNEIESGVYPVGSMIADQEALAERFDCTRPTVQKAIARLVAEGWLMTKRGTGTFVTRSSEPEAQLSTAIAVMFTRNSHDLSSLQHTIIGADHMLSIYQQTLGGWDPAKERQFLETVLHNRCLGLIAFCTPNPPTNEDLLEHIAAQGTRVVHVEPYSVDLPDQDFVLPDYRQAGNTAATTLMLAGYRNFVSVHMNDSPFERLIEAGFAQALRDQGRAYTPDVNRYRIPDLQCAPNRLTSLEQDLRQFHPSTGILCRSLDNARTMAQILRQQGRSLPDDVGLIAVHCECGPADESLDTLVLDRRIMLQKAVDHIINGRGRRLRQLVAPELVRRGSVRQGG